MPNLKTLNLSLESNRIDDVGVKDISIAIKTLTGLTELNLNLQRNIVTNYGATYIAESLQKLTQL